MKKLLLVILLIGFSTSAFANCFIFVNGEGPSTIGNVMLNANQSRYGTSYKAKEICINEVNKLGGGSYTTVTLNDAEGELAGFAAQVANGRCGDRYCKNFQAVSGSAMGRNLTSGQALTVNLTIDAQKNHLGLSGTLTDTHSGKKYILVKYK